MPATLTLHDLIYEEVKKKLPFPLPEAQARAALGGAVEVLIKAGWKIMPPGAIATNTNAARVEGSSVRCPGCGALDPDLGFKNEVREIPQGDRPAVHAAIGYIFCAKETCHTILSVVAAPAEPQKRVIQ